MMDDQKLRLISFFVLGSMIVVAIPLSLGYTCEQDVYAINSLHEALGFPLLPGWIPFGGDPCLEGWQGVECVGPNITAIVLNDANLGGALGDKLGNFTSIITIDLSNNHIGGSIPENLPLTMRQFFLSSNRFTGRIPSSLANLALLSDMSLNENSLSGELPDSFLNLASLVNLDVSSNNLSGQLPPSMSNLLLLTTLHIQNNHLSGTLDVLEDLPLMDLDIENNLFSGPVPVKLWNIPNFRSKGNPFNTTVAPYTSPPLALPPSVAHDPSHSTDAPSPSTDALSTGRGGNTSNRSVIVFVVVALIIVITVPLVMCYLSKCREKKLEHGCMPKSRKKLATEMSKEPLRNTNSVPSKNSGHTPGTHEECNAHIMESSPVLSSHLAEKIDIEKHFVHTGKEKHDLSFKKARPPTENLTLPDSVACFSVGILQQYTNYFAEKHLIRSMHLGKLYLAKDPNGQLLTVMKLDNLTSNINVNEFHELALRASNIRHQNVVELVGYCFEFGQRLFIFSYFSRRTLYDLLHCYDFVDKRLSWNARIKIALDSARALEYLHESCQPPVILKSFEPACILLDDRLAVRISEFGLVSYVFSSSNCQFAGDSTEFSGYEAPEISDSGCFTDRSDVYSFGIVMLELLTGRPAYDSSQSRSEKHLVRWASPQLYDINALSRMVDPSMDGVVSLKSLSRFADIISRCIQQSPEFRPAMSQIVQDLNLVLNDANCNDLNMLLL